MVGRPAQDCDPKRAEPIVSRQNAQLWPYDGIWACVLLFTILRVLLHTGIASAGNDMSAISSGLRQVSKLFESVAKQQIGVLVLKFESGLDTVVGPIIQVAGGSA